jgi:hypothetical protein
VDDAVEDGVCDGGFADHLMPTVCAVYAPLSFRLRGVAMG